jgi:hypothetical protein
LIRYGPIAKTGRIKVALVSLTVEDEACHGVKTCEAWPKASLSRTSEWREGTSGKLSVMSKTVVNDLDVQALVDGELNGDEQERVLAAVRSNPVLKSRYEQLRIQRRLIAAAWMEDEKTSLH